MKLLFIYGTYKYNVVAHFIFICINIFYMLNKQKLCTKICKNVILSVFSVEELVLAASAIKPVVLKVVPREPPD